MDALVLDPQAPLRVVALGGGTGLASTLRSIKSEATRPNHPWKITGVVTASDDGGSSGRLRKEFGSLPPGDLRNCLAALAPDDSPLSNLLQYRFEGKGDLAGHSLGNLMLSALANVSGNWVRALRQLSSILVTVGQLYPSTVDPVILNAEDALGRRLQGESNVNQGQAPLKRFWIEPRDAEALPDTILAISRADVILLSSGSLYTSTLANLLISDIREALKTTKAPIIYVANLMTEPSETLKMTLEQHLEAIECWGQIIPAAVITNQTLLPETMEKRYQEEGGEPIYGHSGRWRSATIYPFDLLDLNSDMARHDSGALNQAILNVIAQSKKKLG